MRIDRPSISGVETRKTESSTKIESGNEDVGEAVVVDLRARVMSAASSRSEAAHTEKLARIARELKDGTYKVDLDRLAERITDDELARAGRSQG
jgi:anti-sigma28 factor (negative regulator of flagellin synthesis)